MLARPGSITKLGRSYSRGLLVDADCGPAQAPGPLCAFFVRVGDRRGRQIAIVATAGKPSVIG